MLFWTPGVVLMTDGFVSEGSEARDVFKRLHKQQAPGNFYALDVDLELVTKGGTAHTAPAPRIVARIDFKRPDDDLEFSEVLSYNWMMMHSVPVYIIEADTVEFINTIPENHRFNIYRYKGGDFARPVNTVTKTVARGLSWDQLVEWERCLRSDGPGTFQERYGSRTLGINDPGNITAYSDGGATE
jgi:hypothetical protein